MVEILVVENESHFKLANYNDSVSIISAVVVESSIWDSSIHHQEQYKWKRGMSSSTNLIGKGEMWVFSFVHPYGPFY